MCVWSFTDKDSTCLKKTFVETVNFNSSPGDGGDSSSPKVSSVNELIIKDGTEPTDFTSLVSFLLQSSCGVNPENDIPVNVKSSLSNLVQFLEQQLVTVMEAKSKELKESMETHRGEMEQLLIHYQKKLIELQRISEGSIREIIKCRLEEFLKDFSGIQCQYSRGAQDNFQRILPDCMRKADVEIVEQLKSIIEEKDKALAALQAEKSQLICKCETMEVQLAEIEQKAAEESLTSGAYVDDHANPSMLEEACKSVDKATENLMRVLHGGSITGCHPSKSQDRLEHFLCRISSASVTDFSRPAQAKYAWGHWICWAMFQGFENVFYDMDDRRMTSPLDPKAHALECFQSFQQKKLMPHAKLHYECDMFQAFCVKKYSKVFPLDLLEMALHPRLGSKIFCDRNGRFNYFNCEVYDHFVNFAKAIWMLHELSFAFDPPANILRMAAGLPFDIQYHEPVVHDEDCDGTARAVLLMIRPAFRLRSTIIRSRVFLSTRGGLDTSKTSDETARR
jgi:hypothetical protein